MPAEFLSAEHRAAYVSFIEVPSLSDLEKFFFLDSFDRNVIAQSRADSHRLGVAVQIGTVRYKGLFLEDPLAVPWPVVDHLAEQLGIGDASQVKKYAERPKTTYEHAWMIRDAYGYHAFDDTSSWSDRQLTRQFRTFLHGRAWTHAEGPVALFEQSVAWLRRHRVLLPGVTVLEHLMQALTIRDVFASPSLRWADPRAHLLAGARWESIAEDVLASLSLTDPVQEHLNGKVLALDAAWKQMAARLEEAGEDALVSVVTPARGGRARLSVEKLGALGESESLAWLRAACQAMLPRIDLPELLLEVHAWTGFLDAYVHLADISTRMNHLPTSLVALLISEACNVGLTPMIKAGDEALTRGRLSHVDQNYVRAETHAAANAILIAHQGKVPIVASWGGGLLASVDGLRFVVPVKTINAGPSPKYYGYKRGITWLNAVNDQVAGIGQMVVPGTPRDSLYILDCLINLDAGPKPELVTTDQASESDMVFGIFSMLGYRFAPRFADLGDQRFWRAELPDGTTSAYGVLEAIARNKLNTKKVITQWPDMLRVAGSLVTNQVRAYDLLRMFARQGSPTPLGQAFAEYGRIDKTMHLLSMLDPMDSSYRRSLGKQLSVQESRHRLARKICHGNSGRIRQAYREGQEDQLAALGLVVNAVVLWNSRYLSAIVDQLRAQGVPVKDEDVARLSPLGHAHLNCLGRYAIASSAPDKGLRPLGAAALPEVSAASAAVVDDDGV
ncbi:Tn3 family transposase [Nonomuraea sp. NPDC049750]|uniref:Tn3 family transposase n=1 Tax=Nonomuraea sp. NPDC049750 TaxID=3154738 RepID=UPI0033BFDE6C